MNQTLPSEPLVMASGSLTAVGVPNSVIFPFGVTRPITPRKVVLVCLALAVNQRLPSGPTVISLPTGDLPWKSGMRNSEIWPVALICPTRPILPRLLFSSVWSHLQDQASLLDRV